MDRINKASFLLASVFVILCCSARCYCNEQVVDLVNNASTEHPRLFLSSKGFDELKSKVAKDGVQAKVFARMKQASDEMLDVKPLEREMIGRRLLTVSREALRRVGFLAMVYRLTGDEKYLLRCKAEMVSAAGFSDWNPSHFLDVAEMTTALAIGYDWLYNDLDENTRKVIKKAILEKGMKPYLEGGWWVNSNHNWNQVCHGGLTVASLAIMEDEKELAAKIITQAIEKLPIALKGYAPDGAYPEGPVYWRYGTSYNIMMISALESVLGSDFGLCDYEGFLKSGQYQLHVTGPSSVVFNYSDANSSKSIKAALYWISNRLSDPSLLWFEKKFIDELLLENQVWAERYFPFLLIWAGDIEQISKPEKLSWSGQGKTPVGFHRSGWDTDDTFVGIKGGCALTNHAHMDAGSFVMEAQGVRWAIDLGSQSYHGLESQKIDLWNKKQDGQRWTIFRLNNFSHNTLVVDGKLQRVNGSAAVIDFSEDAPMPYTVVDMGPVYKGQLANVKRGVGLRKDGSVLIQDDIGTLDRVTNIRWGMVTRAKVEIIDNNTAILKQDGKRLRLEVLSPENCELRVFETEKPVHKYDAENKGTCMIGFENSFAGSKDFNLSVLLQPGSQEVTLPAIQPLSKWGK